MIRYGIRKALTQRRTFNQPQTVGFFCVFVGFFLVCGSVFIGPAAADSGSTTDSNDSPSLLLDPIFQDPLVQGIEDSISEIGEIDLTKAENDRLMQGIEESIDDLGSLVDGLIDDPSGTVNELVTDLGSTPEPVTAERATASDPTQKAPTNAVHNTDTVGSDTVSNNTISSNTVSSNTASVVGQEQWAAGNHQGTGSSKSEEKYLVPFFTTGILTAGAGSTNNSGSSQVGITADLTKLAQLTPMGFIRDPPDPHCLSPYIGLLSPPG